MPEKTTDKRPHYSPGPGGRRDTRHNGNRLKYGHDYSDYGTYLITMVTLDRLPFLGTLCGTTRSDGPAPYIDPSPLGRQILDKEIPAISRHCPLVEVWDRCLMPDHLHMIVRVKGKLPAGKSLGSVIGGFKAGCSKAWWALTGLTPAADAAGTGTVPAHGLPSLFEKGYNNRILMRDGQLQHWKGYIAQNAYRRMFRQEHPDIMRRTLQVEIGGVHYGAFGNLFLLQYPERHHVFFHRRTLEDGLLLPTEETLYWQREERCLMGLAEQGDVLVTPGISECEKRIKNHVLEQHQRLIHLQDTPIGRFWKPEARRFEACEHGSLLILAPWEEDTQPWRESKSALFHHLNDLAASICSPAALGGRVGGRSVRV